MNGTESDINGNPVNQSYLYITKNDSSLGSYDDGVYIYFGDKSPKQITFMMWTDDASIETCDLRLTTIDPNASLPVTNISAYPTPTPPPTPPVKGAAATPVVV